MDHRKVHALQLDGLFCARGSTAADLREQRWMTRSLLPTFARRHKVRGIGVVAALLTALSPGCGGAPHRHLRINAATPSHSLLCDLETRVASTPASGDAVTVEDTNCSVLSGQSLEAPGQLSVTVENAQAGSSYQLRVDEELIASSGETPQAVVAEFARNVGGLAGFMGGKLATLAADSPQVSAIVSADQLNSVAAGLPGRTETVIHRLADSIVPPESESSEPATVAALVLPAFDGGPGHLATPPVGFDNDDDVPFVRSRVLTDADLGTLGAAGYSANEIADFASHYCANSSWGQPTNYTSDLPTLAAQPFTREQVLGALGLDASLVVAWLGGEGGRLRDRIEQAFLAASEAGQPGATPDANALVFRQLLLEASLARDLDRCHDNLEALGRRADVDAPRHAALAATLQDVDALRSVAQDAVAIYDTLVLPFVTEIATQYLEGIANADGTVEFGTRTLHAGHVSVTLSEEAADASLTPITSLDVDVRTSPRIAVSVGALMTFCDGCLLRQRDEAVAASGTLPAGRVIRQYQDSFAAAAVVALHVSLAWVGDHHFGLMLGYPLGQTTQSALTALFGGSYRFAPIGLQVGVGVQLFEQQRLTSRDDPSTAGVDEGRIVDLRAPGNELLTVADVTSTDVGVAGFATLGLSLDFLSGL